jgi:hypothetical protein
MNENDEMNRRHRMSHALGALILAIGLALVAWGVHSHMDWANRSGRLQNLIRLYVQSGQKIYLDQAKLLMEDQERVSFAPLELIALGTVLAMYGFIFIAPRWFFKERFFFGRRQKENDAVAPN